MKILRSVIGWWLLLLFISLPMDYRFLPDFGSYLSRLLLPINEWISVNLFSTSVQNTFTKSDSLAFFIGAILLLVVSLLAHLIIGQRIKPRQNFIPLLLIGFLSYYLICYGFDKIIGVQFYEASPNTLHTSLGRISKDLLFWNTMGASQFYNWFMAISEILAGLLLFFNRTRFIGLLFSFGILLNIFALNIGFDITVKFLSGLLLLTCLFLLTYYKERITQLVSPTIRTNAKGIIFRIQNTNSKLFLSLFLSLVIIEVALPAFTHRKQHPLNSKSFLITNSTDFDKVHFHADGYLIFQKEEQFFSQKSIFHPSRIITKINAYEFSIDGIRLTLIDDSGKKIRGTLIDNQALPLLQDDVHLYLEQILP